MCQRSYLSTWYESLDAFSGDMLGHHSFSNLSDLVAIDFGTLGRLNTLAFENSWKLSASLSSFSANRCIYLSRAISYSRF